MSVTDGTGYRFNAGFVPVPTDRDDPVDSPSQCPDPAIGAVSDGTAAAATPPGADASYESESLPASSRSHIRRSRSITSRHITSRSITSRHATSRSIASRSVMSRSMAASYGPDVPTGLVDENPDILPAAIGDDCGIPVPDRPLDVVHVGPFFLRGGAEQWLLDLIRHVDPRYLRFRRCVSTQAGLVDISYVSALSSLGVTLEAGGADSVQMAAREADVLLSWGVELETLLGDERPAMSVQVVHGDGPMNAHFLERSRRVIDHAVAVSHRVKRRVCRDVPTTVIYNGVDASRLAPHRSRGDMRRRLGFAREDFVVGYVGRFAPEKRPQVIAEAVARLPERFKALYVGWGRLLPNIRQICESSLPGRHVITHATGNLGDLYRAMDVVCLVSDQEGFPMVLLEAMLCGRPVAATPVGSIPELIDDRVNGLLVDGSAGQVAEVLRHLAANPAWRRGVARQGFELASRFGHARRMARDYEHLLFDLWNGKSLPQAAPTRDRP